MESENISRFESFLRIFLGIAIFLFGYSLNDLLLGVEPGRYPLNVIFSLLFRYRNVVQILSFFFGFVLFFTGITRFSPLKKLLSKKQG